MVVLDGSNDYVLIPDLPDYDLLDATIQITFSVDALDGTDTGTNIGNSALNTLFSRDATGFGGGGHVTAVVDGDGSILIRHQTDSGSFNISTAAGIVTAGEEITLVYTIEEGEGATLFVDDGVLTEIGSTNGDVSLSGNDQPWILGASQVRSRTEDGDRLRSFFDGAIKSFEVFSATTDADPNNEAPVAADDSATVLEDGSVLIDVLLNDTDANGDALELVRDQWHYRGW